MITMQKYLYTGQGLVLLALLIMVLTLGGCLRRQTDRRAGSPEQPASRISLQEAPGTEEMTELPTPQIEAEKEPDYTFKKPENVFDLELKNVELRTVLQTICDELSYNLVMDPEIVDTVNLSLKNVTFFQFLEVALARKNYKYRVQENFIYVTAPKLETRIFNLDYLNTARQLQGTMNIVGQTGAAGGTLSPQSQTTLTTQNILNLWSDIRNGLVQIVLGTGQQVTPNLTAEGSFAGKDEETGYSLIVNPGAGVVQITAVPEVLDQAEVFIEAIEKSLQRQVMIEARLVEIQLNKNFEAGLDWSIIPDLSSVSNLAGSLSGGALASQSLSPVSREFQVGVSNEKISTILTAMSKHGQVNVLQSPRTSALNNQPAVIRVARNETFFQRTETPGQPATATSAATLPVVNYNPITQPTGVVLNLTPQISDDGLIIMSIRPSITTIAGVAVSPDGLSTSPITDVRELDTVAKVRHGQTIILAGLIQERELENIKETPGLAKLPILGGLFKQKVTERQKVELVILLTPYINYSRTAKEISTEELPRYKNVAEHFNISNDSFKH